MKLRLRWFSVFFIAVVVYAGSLSGKAITTLTSEQIVTRAREWMAGHPVMAPAAARGVKAVTAFPPDADACVYVVELEPNGYLVMNSDVRLTPVIAFDEASTVDLSDTPENAFRGLLASYTAKLPDTLRALPADAPPVALRSFSAQSTQTYGPYLTTSWNQTHPYNLYVPAVPEGSTGLSSGYGGRAPVGCVSIVYSQIMYYHRWPVRASGSYTYTDSVGEITGTHTADFSEPYEWAVMKNSYDPQQSAPQPGDTAVASLIYRMAVASEANFEPRGTPTSVLTPANIAAEFLHYEQGTYISNIQNALAAANADIIAGFPCLVAITGHAIVADGLITGSGSDTYHINYGWGGNNNGWWTADNVAGAALQYSVTGIRPRLTAFPQTQTATAVAGEPLTLNWALPQRRETEVAQINIKQFAAHTEPWIDTADNFQDAASSGWAIHANGYSGSAWFANGYNDTLTLSLEFRPTTDSTLSFQFKPQVYERAFYIQVSTDHGASWNNVFTAEYVSKTTWEKKSHSARHLCWASYPDPVQERALWHIILPFRRCLAR